MISRALTVLSIAALLAACDSSGSLGRRALIAPPAASSGAVTPGAVAHDPCGSGNIGNALYFEIDSAVLTPEAQQSAQAQACWIKLYTQHTLTIEGHADERGTREYNLALGERRAQSVVNYFTALGIDPKRLKTISYGKERPVCTEANETCWSQNRRTVSTLDN